MVNWRFFWAEEEMSCRQRRYYFCTYTHSTRHFKPFKIPLKIHFEECTFGVDDGLGLGRTKLQISNWCRSIMSNTLIHSYVTATLYDMWNEWSDAAAAVAILMQIRLNVPHFDHSYTIHTVSIDTHSKLLCISLVKCSVLYLLYCTIRNTLD